MFKNAIRLCPLPALDGVLSVCVPVVVPRTPADACGPALAYSDAPHALQHLPRRAPRCLSDALVLAVLMWPGLGQSGQPRNGGEEGGEARPGHVPRPRSTAAAVVIAASAAVAVTVGVTWGLIAPLPLPAVAPAPRLERLQDGLAAEALHRHVAVVVQDQPEATNTHAA